MLEVNNITCGYTDETVLKEISFNVEGGEMFGVIGPNGSGKTTLMRAITGTIRLQSGNIVYIETDIAQMTYKDVARNIAVVSSYGGADNMIVEDFVLMGRIPHYGRFQFLETSHDRMLADKYMEMTDLLKLKHKPVNEISTGELQLALVARALCQEPGLLLLDEPTAHLDITHQVGIMDLIKQLNRDLKLTVLVVLHDLNLASEYCDRLLLIKEGRIHSSGTPQKVLTYKNVEEVYKTVVVVKQNPYSLKPHILLVSKDAVQGT